MALRLVCSDISMDLYSKLFNAYSLFKENTVHSPILIGQSSKEVWWKNQEGRIRNGKEVNSLGNRQNWGLVKSGIKSSSHWFDMPITGFLILERDISVDEYNQFKMVILCRYTI